MAQFSKTDQRRITFLSLLSSAAIAGPIGVDAYAQAHDWLEAMEADGFFDVELPRPTQQRSEPSRRPASRGQSSNSGSRGRDQARGGGQGMRDPDGPPSDKQVGFLLSLTDDYTEDEAFNMTKKEVSELIEDLKS